MTPAARDALALIRADPHRAAGGWFPIHALQAERRAAPRVFPTWADWVVYYRRIEDGFGELRDAGVVVGTRRVGQWRLAGFAEDGDPASNRTRPPAILGGADTATDAPGTSPGAGDTGGPHRAAATGGRTMTATIERDEAQATEAAAKKPRTAKQLEVLIPRLEEKAKKQKAAWEATRKQIDGAKGELKEAKAAAKARK